MAFIAQAERRINQVLSTAIGGTVAKTEHFAQVQQAAERAAAIAPNPPPAPAPEPTPVPVPVPAPVIVSSQPATTIVTRPAASVVKRNKEIPVTELDPARAAYGAGLAGGDTGLVLDPLGRRGRGPVGHATLLGR